MKTFNLNDHILVNITKYGWDFLLGEVGQDYIDACILPNKQVIDDIEYYKLQAHQMITLFGNAIWAANPCPINSNILIPD